MYALYNIDGCMAIFKGAVIKICNAFKIGGDTGTEIDPKTKKKRRQIIPFDMDKWNLKEEEDANSISLNLKPEEM